VNPNVILIAEPWGGHYRPHEFSEHGWASWNDKFRNGIKGHDPTQHNGFIFSSWIEGCSVFSLHNWLNGTHISGADGLFQDNRHAVNYLESHDGYTLGDYIRLVFRPELRSFFRYTDDEILPLRNEEMKIAKLAALALFTTPGIPMIHQGQEFANSKICRSFTFEDEGGVFLDHNSYEKDDPTNWLDFTRIQFNLSLYRFYKGLIEIRHHSPALRKADEKHAHFAHSIDPLHVVKYVHGGIHDLFDYVIGLNASTSNTMTVHLPGGIWELLSDGEIATIHALDFKQRVIEVSPKQGVLLRKLSQCSS
jgi:pullulanase/glycogen debranching enzyme